MIFHAGLDGIKYIDKIVDCERIIKDLSPKLFADIESGELQYPIYLGNEAIKGIILDANNGTGLYLKLQGSIHELHNYINGLGCTNYNKFTIEHAIRTVRYLCGKYGINPNCLLYTSPSPRDRG